MVRLASWANRSAGCANGQESRNRDGSASCADDSRFSRTPCVSFTGQETQVETRTRNPPDHAYVFVTPEYNHGTSGALKNAIDYLFKEWNNKVAGFVGCGSAGGVRAVEHLRLVMAELMVADVRAHVGLSLYTDFENFSVFKPAPFHEQSVNAMLDQVIAWGGALKRLRDP
jgi:hypothetical protein